ncbi:MAG: GNAT family N-acetyltransferase [Nitrospiraceae bacterium]|nr:GNAT family N-acetyltransferase [Nitrospiraceae bacterium]
MNTLFRSGTVDDAAACGTICYEAFKAISEQHNFPPDFPTSDMAVGLLTMVLSRPDVYSVIAEMDGRVIGSNFLWEGDIIAGVGPITVAPAAQNSSVGRHLMERVLVRASEGAQVGVRLVQAAYHNRSLSLYTKLGFQGREPLSVLQGPPVNVAIPGYRVRSARPADLSACDALCEKVHGHKRHGETAYAISAGTAKVVEHGGEITGYGTDVGFFAHAVGRTNEELKALIGAAEAFTGPGFLLPTRNADLLRWCLTHGLRVTQPMTLMSRGLYQKPAGAFLPSILY